MKGLLTYSTQNCASRNQRLQSQGWGVGVRTFSTDTATPQKPAGKGLGVEPLSSPPAWCAHFLPGLPPARASQQPGAGWSPWSTEQGAGRWKELGCPTEVSAPGEGESTWLGICLNCHPWGPVQPLISRDERTYFPTFTYRGRRLRMFCQFRRKMVLP